MRALKVITYAILVLLTVIYTIYNLSIINVEAARMVIPYIYVIVCSWSLYVAYRQWETLFNPWVLFLIAAILFNGGHILLRAIGISIYNPYAPVFSERITVETWLLVTTCIAAFVFGGLLAGRSDRQLSVPKELHNDKKNGQLLWIVGWVMVAVSAWPSAVTIVDGVKTVMEVGYFALYSSPVETGIDSVDKKLTGLLVPGLMFVLAGSDKQREWGRYVSLTMILLYSCGLLFQGYRATSVMPLLGFAWLWHKSVRPLQTRLLLIWGAVALLVVFPLVKQARNLSGSERLSAEAIMEAYTSIENPAVAIVSEMGRSMETISHSLELVPATRQFDYGSGYVAGALTVIPNFGSGLHLAADYTQYGKWLTQEVNPWLASRGGGVGFSFIAEAYVNFGWIGAPLLIMLMGFLLAKLVLWTSKYPNPGRLAVMAAFTSFFLLYARGEFAYIIRPFVWFSMMPYIVVFVLKESLSSKGIGLKHEASKVNHVHEL